MGNSRFVPSPMWWVQALGPDLAELFESSHTGRESLGKSFWDFWGVTSPTTPQLPKVFGQHLEYSGPGHSLGTKRVWWDSLPPWEKVSGFGDPGGAPRSAERAVGGAGSAPRSGFGDQQGSAGVPVGCDPPRDLGGFGI